MKKIHWQDVVVLLTGLWLAASALFLQFNPSEGTILPLSGWNFLASGVVGIVLAGAALLFYRNWEEWLTVVLGGWVVVSPWILNYADNTQMVWNAVICGAIFVVMGLWNTLEENESLQF